MKLNEVQNAALVMQLSALGQRDLSDNDLDTLEHLAGMLDMALDNVRANIQTILEKDKPNND